MCAAHAREIPTRTKCVACRRTRTRLLKPHYLSNAAHPCNEDDERSRVHGAVDGAALLLVTLTARATS